MQLRLEELAAWSPSELASGIQVYLSEGSRLDINSQPGYFVVKILDSEGVPLIEEVQPDQRLALLNVFGKLLATPKSLPTDSPWCRHKELPKRVAPIRTTPSVDDLGDLDPTEINNLYKIEGS